MVVDRFVSETPPAIASPIATYLPTVRGSYRAQALLAPTNWFRVGGPAEILYRPEDAADLAYFLQHKPQDLPYIVLGVGSNLLIRDGGIAGVVIKLGKGFAEIRVLEHQILAGAGALSAQVAKAAQAAGLSGAEFLIGIPGTFGGALAMNAGAYGSDIAQCLSYAEVVSPSGDICLLKPDEIRYVYRGKHLPADWIFTAGCLNLTPDDPVAIAARMETIMQQREASQPIRSRTSGSTFKNPAGHRAWELIDNAGLRGKMVGGAQVSEKHCNFLINTGKATAADLETLGEMVRKEVAAKTGIWLEWEVMRVGIAAAPLIENSN